MTLSASNEDQVGALYREMRPELLRYFRARHGSDEAAEDLLQETFAAALKNPARLLEADSPRSYLFGMARHISIDALRRHRQTEPLDAREEADPETSDILPESSALRLETMRQAIAGLNPVLRQVLELRLSQELCYQEIADALGIPIGTVRSRLHYAIRELAAVMKSMERL